MTTAGNSGLRPDAFLSRIFQHTTTWPGRHKRQTISNLPELFKLKVYDYSLCVYHRCNILDQSHCHLGHHYLNIWHVKAKSMHLNWGGMIISNIQVAVGIKCECSELCVCTLWICIGKNNCFLHKLPSQGQSLDPSHDSWGPQTVTTSLSYNLGYKTNQKKCRPLLSGTQWWDDQMVLCVFSLIPGRMQHLWPDKTGSSQSTRTLVAYA